MEIDYCAGTNPVLRFRVKGLKGERDLLLKVDYLVHGGKTSRTPETNAKSMGAIHGFGIVDKYGPVSACAFLIPTYNATTSNLITMYDNANSGEAEYVVLGDNNGDLYVTVGSDHSDRDLARTGGAAKSRLSAPKVIAREAWPYDEVKEHWDELVMRSSVLRDEGTELHQEEKVGLILNVDSLLTITKEQTGLRNLENTVIFSGTIPSKKGKLAFGKGWDLELFDPVLKRTIKHHYDIKVAWHRVPPYPTAERPPEF